MVKPFVYYGTSEFARIILSGLLKAGLRPILVVTVPPKSQGRGLKIIKSPVAETASLNNLDLLEVASLKDSVVLEKLKHFKTEFALLAAFGQIVPKVVLDLYDKGIVNVHPSLLPLYRGASPIASVLKDGQSKTGLSLMLLDNLMDHGPLLKQIDYNINKDQTADNLAADLADLAVKILPETLSDYLSGQLKPLEQDHSRATYTGLISRVDGRANFNLSANQLNNQRRAFEPWPGLWTDWQGRTVKLLKTGICHLSQTKPGLVRWVEGQGLVIECRLDGLVIKSLQLAGKKPLSAEDFIRGQKSFLGTVLL
ncbi:MAG: methionyl-tRNA formyltransferase [Patescibacteria group bacterium]